MTVSRRRFLAGLAAATASLAIPAGIARAGDDEFVMARFPHLDPGVEFFNDWGDSRPGGRRHRGTDIFSPKLTPVVAVADGFVERLKKGRRSGYYVRLRHAGPWETYYMHLNNDTPGTDDGDGGEAQAYAPELEVGSYVAAGDLIGFVGDSGNAEGSRPHTHFELHRNGTQINPYSYLVAALERRDRVWEMTGRMG